MKGKCPGLPLLHSVYIPGEIFKWCFQKCWQKIKNCVGNKDFGLQSVCVCVWCCESTSNVMLPCMVNCCPVFILVCMCVCVCVCVMWLFLVRVLQMWCYHAYLIVQCLLLCVCVCVCEYKGVCVIFFFLTQLKNKRTKKLHLIWILYDVFSVSLFFTAIDICLRIYFLFDTSNFLKKKYVLNMNT